MLVRHDLGCASRAAGADDLQNFCKPQYKQNTYNIESYEVAGYTMDENKVCLLSLQQVCANLARDTVSRMLTMWRNIPRGDYRITVSSPFCRPATHCAWGTLTASPRSTSGTNVHSRVTAA